MPTKSRLIPGNTAMGVTRGGGSETITWSRNGPLLLQRSYTLFQPSWSLPSPYNEAGHAVYGARNPALPTGSADSDGTVKSDGTTAIALSRPLSPSVALLTSAGELNSDGLPNPGRFLDWEKATHGILSERSARSAKKFARESAGNYLAVQFGWLPLLADIRNFCKQVRDSDRILRESLETRQRRVIKVGYTFPSAYRTNYHTHNPLTNITVARWDTGNAKGDSAPGYEEIKFYNKTWFEAEYLNLLPVSKDQTVQSFTYAEKARYILGLKLTPETLWELAPWSWAVDWLTNTGDIISSVSNWLSDGLVMRDGFVMHHHRRHAKVAATGPHIYKGAFWVGPLWSPTLRESVSETKKRFVSVPYFGFGSVGELTPRQLSIIAALGISRA